MAKGQKRMDSEPKKASDVTAKKAKKLAGPKYMQGSTSLTPAALKGISSEILEAARVDGATEGQIFRRIIVPMLSLPISVIAVTLTINVVKLFDLVYIMTKGGPGNASNVIAVQMYQQFSARNFDYSATVAVVMLIILIPVMIFNIRRFRSERVVA